MQENFRKLHPHGSGMEVATWIRRLAEVSPSLALQANEGCHRIPEGAEKDEEKGESSCDELAREASVQDEEGQSKRRGIRTKTSRTRHT